MYQVNTTEELYIPVMLVIEFPLLKSQYFENCYTNHLTIVGLEFCFSLILWGDYPSYLQIVQGACLYGAKTQTGDKRCGCHFPNPNSQLPPNSKIVNNIYTGSLQRHRARVSQSADCAH